MKPALSFHHRFFWIFLFTLGLVSIFLARLATSTYGSGVGTDGAIQIATADHLLAGKGFYDYTEKPFVRWPPLYPIILAALSRLAGQDTFTIGWYLNVVLLGVIVWLGGLLLYFCFEGQILWAFIGSLVIATSVSLLSLSAHIGTDPLFIVLSLAYILAANRYLQAKTPGSLFALALIACLASLQRLPGIIMIGMTFILIVYANSDNLLKCLRQGLLFSAVPLLPLASWIFVHNYVLNQTLFGVYAFEATLPVVNFQDSLGKMWHWFVPYSLSARFYPLLPVGLTVLAVIEISRRRDWTALGRRLLQPPIFSSLLFGGLYFVFLIFTINSVDTSYDFYDRYHIVILVPILIFIFIILQGITRSLHEQRPTITNLLIFGIFSIWLVYPVFSVYKYVRLSRMEGVTPYNIYNTRAMHESKMVLRLMKLSSDFSRDLYSNYPAAAWFYTRRSVFESPRGTILQDIDVDQLIQEYKGWPGSRPGYLVWFLPNEYDHVLEPRDLNRLAQLNLIYKGKDGELYYIRARSP